MNPLIYRCPECKGTGADFSKDDAGLPCAFCFGGGDICPQEITNKGTLINWLAEWREKHKGSISEFNNRRNLLSRTTDDLRKLMIRILENESRAA